MKTIINLLKDSLFNKAMTRSFSFLLGFIIGMMLTFAILPHLIT